jgi:hypothetical protein
MFEISRKTTASLIAPNSAAAFSIASSTNPNQRITTDSALHPFVTHFFTRLPWRHGARALRERARAGRLA